MGSFTLLTETENYVFTSGLGSSPARWFYVTAYDEWGNESPPSGIIKIQIPGLREANGPSLKEDLQAIFEPVWRDFSFGGGQVA